MSAQSSLERGRFSEVVLNQHPNDFIIRALASRGIDHPELLDLQEIQKLCEYLSTLIGEPLEESDAPPALRVADNR